MSPTTAARVFIDSSVLIAAAISGSGNARVLLLRGLSGEEEIYVSDFVLAETERNLTRKAPRALSTFTTFREMLTPRLSHPSKALVEECAHVVEMKDAPIVAGALATGADWIVSYDQKHLLHHSTRIFERFKVHVGTPGEYLHR